MLGLNGIIIDWSLLSKLKSIWINQLLSRKSLGSGQEASLRPCTLPLAVLYFVLYPQTQWEIFSFLPFFLIHLTAQKKTAFIEIGSRLQALRSPYLCRLPCATCREHLPASVASQCTWPGDLPSFKTLCWELGKLPPRLVKPALEYSTDGKSRFVPTVMLVVLSCRSSKADGQIDSSTIRREW